MSETKDIKMGSVVRLKSDDDDGPKMTVTEMPSKPGDFVGLNWRTKDGEPHHMMAPREGLRVVE